VAHKAPKLSLRSSGVPDSKNNTINRTRLTLARRRRGLTKTQLAHAIGVDLRSVTAFEAGEYLPGEETMSRIVSSLRFPCEFFYGDDLDEPRPDTASFRAMSKMSASQRDMALSQGAIALHLNNWLERRFELPAASLPDLSHETNPEAAALFLRQMWALGELPIRNAIHLLESKGIRVFSLAIDAREVDAFSMWKGSTPFVFLNSYKSSEHSRFDAAHELGHLVLHKHASPHGREAEREADAFASAFLMPRGSVLASAPRLATIPVLVRLKRVWSVSVAALNYRLHALKVTTDWQYRRLCIEIGKLGYRESEPNEAPRETSQMLQKMLSVMAGEGISRAKIAKDLAIPVSELEHLLFGLALAGIAGGRRGANHPDRRSSSLSVVK